MKTTKIEWSHVRRWINCKLWFRVVRRFERGEPCLREIRYYAGDDYFRPSLFFAWHWRGTNHIAWLFLPEWMNFNPTEDLRVRQMPKKP